jgi:rRNA maturation RNase YbeY
MRRAQLFSRQRARRVDRIQWRRLTRCLLEDLLGRREYELGVHLVGADEMARLNRKFLGHEGSTDVITFNYQEDPGSEKLRGEVMRQSRMAGMACRAVRRFFPERSPRRGDPTFPRPAVTDGLHGEIFISVDDALDNARRFRVRWPWELARYLVHGILHLEGCQDTKPDLRRAMKRRENKLLKELSRRLDLGKLEG